MTTTRTVTTTREYDADGKLVKETTVETTNTHYATYPTYIWTNTPTYPAPYIYSSSQTAQQPLTSNRIEVTL